MSAIRIPPRQRLVIDGISWKGYLRLLHGLSDRHLRITYDRGFLEIMTLSHKHENLSRFLGSLILVIALELNLPIHLGGSTPLKRKRKQKGLEPDDCYWIAQEAAVRGKAKIDLRRDPPPDLAIEVDVSRSSLNRMDIYAKFGIPEIWRYDKSGLAFFKLNPAGQYDAPAVSSLFPLMIAPHDLQVFIDQRGRLDDTAILQQVRAWIIGRLTPPQP